MNIGIIGLGMAAKNFHLPLLKLTPYFNVTAVLSEKSQKEIERLVDNVTVFRDLADFSESDLFELAIVLTPNHLHFVQAKKLLQNNKHVVVDKPLAISVDEVQTLKILAEKNNCLLTIFNNRRWDGDFITIQKLLRENTLGQLTYFESRFDKYRPEPSSKWKEDDFPGSGLLFDLMPHLGDQAFQLFGLPEAIFGQVAVQRKGGVVADYFNVKLIYPTLEVVLRSSSLAAFSPYRFYLEGTKGSFIKQHFDVQETLLQYKDANEKWIVEPETNFGHIYRGEEPVVVPTIPGDYRCFYQNLERFFSVGEALAVTPEDAVNTALLIEKILKSSEENKVVDW